MTADPAVRTHDLRRTYRGRRGKPETVALAGITMSVPAGEIHGLLGPNGAGKTTLCKILSTVLLPTGGTADIDGLDVVSQLSMVRKRIGVVFGGERGLYTRLTARANLEFWCALYGLSGRELRRRVDTLLDRVGLADWADDRVESFSRGMKQRVHLARGLVGDPRVLLLDEPTTGMDPVAAREFRVMVGQLRAEGRTILLTTHDMAEAEAVCDRVTLVDGGRILATERPATLGRWLSVYSRVEARDIAPARIDALLGELAILPGIGSVRRPAGSAGLRVEAVTPEATAAVLRLLLDAGVTDVATSKPSLEEVYLQVFGSRRMQVPG